MPDATPEVPLRVPHARIEPETLQAIAGAARGSTPSTPLGVSAALHRTLDAESSPSVYPSFRRARSMTHSEARDSTRGWTTRDAMELFNVHAWGAPYFTINAAGNVEVRPSGTESPAIDLYELVDDLDRKSVV